MEVFQLVDTHTTSLRARISTPKVREGGSSTRECCGGLVILCMELYARGAGQNQTQP